MSFGNFGSESKPKIGSDFTINQYQNASAHNQKANLAASTATLTFKTTAPADYEDSVLTLVSTSGTSKPYIFMVGGGKSTGDIESGAVVAQINGLSTAGAIAAELRSAINSANGHNAGSSNSVISIAISGVTPASFVLTQVVSGDGGNTSIGQTDVSVSALEVPSSFAGGVSLNEIPFSLGLSGVLPFNIGSGASRSAYTITKGKQISTE